MKKIQILGTGCSKCKILAKIVEEVTEAQNIECKIEKVTDIREIMKFGVMMTPALVIDGEVKVSGKVPSTDEVKKILFNT